jgi:hypothetical protein
MIDKAVRFLKRPTTLVYLASLLILLVGLALTYRVRPFTSDDTFWQTILMNGWLPFQHATVTLGNSSIHIDKLPLYWLFDALASPSRKVLFIESSLIAIASFTAFYWSCIYLLGRIANKARLSFTSLVPFLWIVGLGYAFLSLYLDPDWRSFEISFSFVIFALTYAFWRGDTKLQSVRSRLLLVLLVTYVGLLIYSDPYILYFALAPLGLFAVIAFFPLRKISLGTSIVTLFSVIASFVLATLFSALGSQAGVTIQIKYDYIAFVDFSQLGSNIAQTIHSVLVIFGADFFGHHITASLITPLLSFAVLAVITYAIYKVTIHVRTQPSLNALWLLFFSAVLLLSLAFYALTNTNQGVVTYRYLLFPVLLCALPFSYFITTLKRRSLIYALTGIMVVSIVFNIASLRDTTTDNRANIDNYQVIGMLKSLGYTKGYAGYWDANINSYLSADSVRVLPSLCTGPKMTQWQWLINDDAFHKETDKSFYIYNPNAPWPIVSQGNLCDDTTLSKQFGSPVRKLAYKQEVIYLYDYDITDRL